MSQAGAEIIECDWCGAEDVRDNMSWNYSDKLMLCMECQKEYNEDNKEHILEYQKQYRQQNKQQLNERQNQKITCECGSSVARKNLARHNRTKKHQYFMNSKES